eukprot:5593-Heterococcus_DN1.PRE.9
MLGNCLHTAVRATALHRVSFLATLSVPSLCQAFPYGDCCNRSSADRDDQQACMQNDFKFSLGLIQQSTKKRKHEVKNSSIMCEFLVQALNATQCTSLWATLLVAAVAVYPLWRYTGALDPEAPVFWYDAQTELPADIDQLAIPSGAVLSNTTQVLLAPQQQHVGPTATEVIAAQQQQYGPISICATATVAAILQGSMYAVLVRTGQPSAVQPAVSVGGASVAAVPGGVSASTAQQAVVVHEQLADRLPGSDVALTAALQRAELAEQRFESATRTVSELRADLAVEQALSRESAIQIADLRRVIDPLYAQVASLNQDVAALTRTVNQLLAAQQGAAVMNNA